MSDDEQSPRSAERAGTPNEPARISPARRGFWLGFKTTAWVLGTLSVAALAYLVYDSVTGEPAPYLVATILGLLCFSFSVGLMLSLLVGAGAALWMTVFSLPPTRKSVTARESPASDEPSP